MGVARLAWNEKIETRVAKTSNILAQLKSVKMMGLTPPMSSSVQNLRNAEIKTSLTERRLRVVLHALSKYKNKIVKSLRVVFANEPKMRLL